jgi:hypothetical protein
VDKRPHRPVIDLHPAFGQLGPKTAQRKICLRALQQPVPVFTDQFAWSVPAYLPRSDTARRVVPLQPFDRRAHRHAKTPRRRVPRQTTLFNCFYNPFAKIHRIRSWHNMLASCPSRKLESQNQVRGNTQSIQSSVIPL